jgi:rRNA-processing protein FCF1
MQKVILDSSTLLSSYEYKIDLNKSLYLLFNEPVELVFSTSLLGEIRALAKKSLAARFVLQNFEKITQGFKVSIVKSNLVADKWIFNYAKQHNAIVATNDAQLKLRLKNIDVKIVTLKGKSKIDFI